MAINLQNSQHTHTRIHFVCQRQTKQNKKNEQFDTMCHIVIDCVCEWHVFGVENEQKTKMKMKKF